MHRPSYRIVSCSKKSSVCVNLVLEACTRQHKRQQPYLSRICSIGSYPAPKNHLFDSSQFTQFYNVTLNIGQPSKPYFLDPDTGSDLTWLQCDAPCVQCTKTPHPLYMPNKNLVPCKDPLCKSLHLHGCKCETPEQCEYEVQCGYDQSPGPFPHPFDGVLGLGKGKSSIVSQLSTWMTFLHLDDLSGHERHYGQIGDSLIFGSPYINHKNINNKKMTSTMLFYREALQVSDRCYTLYGHILDETKRLGSRQCHFQHVKRDENRLAHGLARRAALAADTDVWGWHIPGFMVYSVLFTE
ncbi:hypothetical protein SO802_029800 [Lithocarpus litseifolius]|uniref:Xylanase inhibitor N-terminal domain-containing protein n=1 Tax=Lithocarpus litseifolius TaxID=425828 RepID=A0AAW2BW21_9ROSI